MNQLTTVRIELQKLFVKTVIVALLRLGASIPKSICLSVLQKLQKLKQNFTKFTNCELQHLTILYITLQHLQNIANHY